MSDFETKWYDTWYSVVVVRPECDPQSKGPWTDLAPLEEMLTYVEKDPPEGTLIYVVQSRCGCVTMESAKTWRWKQEAMREAFEAMDEYVRNGVCSTCGACSLKDAKGKCRPHSTPCGEWTCAGEGLWEGQEEDGEETCASEEGQPL